MKQLEALTTPYINTIPAGEQPDYPGDWALEKSIKSIIRWNAMAMVVQANREHSDLGGHISTYASIATLFEVGFNHFFRAGNEHQDGDLVCFQGHASPGIYARAFLEGRLTKEQLHAFRQECGGKSGLSSYPHPWLMPDFWEMPTVSMGLGPIMAIYQARFNRYLEHRKIRDTSDSRIWCFLGDGECDEPEALGALSVAGREQLDNLIFVVSCNLQRLDGPVRGNGKIIQELEAVFRGAGWNVIKLIWGRDWDPLLKADREGLLVRRMEEAVDGDYQKYSVAPGSYIREHFFGKYGKQLLGLVEHLSDRQLQKLNRGGHDSRKVYAAYKAAVEHRGGPTVILAKTIKGYGLGEAGEGRNVSHKQKKLNDEELLEFRARFGIPIDASAIHNTPFYRPAADSPEVLYIKKRREELGGYVPARRAPDTVLDVPRLEYFEDLLRGTGERHMATTMAFVRLLRKLLKEKKLGRHVVPIVPDEARTFGMDALFREHGIYSSLGQRYEPVDRETLLYYREAKDGQLLEEGITEAGAASSFIAAGNAYSRHNVPMLPFYIFYSMFGFQRIGDLIWAAADSRTRGFLLGATAGRTTLAGEGLQHQDGHSHLLATTVPNLLAYDPAFAYELVIIIQEGMRRLLEQKEDLIIYITLYNEVYPMPPMPEGARDGILRGMYRLPDQQDIYGQEERPRAQLLGSGPILREVLEAQKILAEQFDVASDIWSVTSYKELRREALEAERHNRLHPMEEPRRSYLERTLEGVRGPFVAASDYMRLVCEQIARWVPGKMTVLGTDGFGRSDTREALRRHFEINAAQIAYAALFALAEQGDLKRELLPQAIERLGIDPQQVDPALA